MIGQATYGLDCERIDKAEEEGVGESPAFFFDLTVEVQGAFEDDWFGCLDFLYFVLDVD